MVILGKADQEAEVFVVVSRGQSKLSNWKLELGDAPTGCFLEG